MQSGIKSAVPWCAGYLNVQFSVGQFIKINLNLAGQCSSKIMFCFSSLINVASTISIIETKKRSTWIPLTFKYLYFSLNIYTSTQWQIFYYHLIKYPSYDDSMIVEYVE